MLKRQIETIDPDALATKALAYVASDPERLGRFLALSGLDPGSIRQASRSPGFLPAVLDHVLSDERLLLAFASDAGLRPERVAEARASFDRPPADA
jgi:hypothetical protein